jgi:hypothetical protein
VRTLIFCIAVFGSVIFGAAFISSFVKPILVERIAREIVRIEVEKEVGEKVDSLSNSRIVSFAQKVLNKTDEEIAENNRQLKAEIPQKVASVIADMLNADCECRKRIVNNAEQNVMDELSSLTQVRAHLKEYIELSYKHVATSLLREFRIFTGANTLVFVALGLVTVRRHQASVQLLLPAFVLIGAATLTGGLYLFGQNWLHTIVFNEYVGLGYFAYLAIALVLLWDVAFNRARVSTQIINCAASAVGSAFQVVPC